MFNKQSWYVGFGFKNYHAWGIMNTESILYDDNGTEINFGGYFHEDEYGQVGRGPDMAVTGGMG